MEKSNAKCICSNSIIPKVWGWCPACRPETYAAQFARHRKGIIELMYEKPIPVNDKGFITLPIQRSRKNGTI